MFSYILKIVYSKIQEHFNQNSNNQKTQTRVRLWPYNERSFKMKVLKIVFPITLLGALSITAISQEQRRTMEIYDVTVDNIGIENAEEVFETKEETEINDYEVISEKIAMYPEYVFEEINIPAYLIKESVIKDIPYDNGNTIETLNKYDEIILTGKNDLKYWEIKIDKNTYYIEQENITTDKSVIEQMQEEERKVEEARIAEEKRKAEEEARKSQSRSYTWNGSVLTPSAGVNYGPSGKETYYNLNMSGVISIMRGMGYTGEYWVRNDGCKMLGNYIMVAANLSVHPRGSLVETSLGTGIVCDTGGFAAGNPNQLDIATTW